jgi:DNA polymerase III alpha subunit
MKAVKLLTLKDGNQKSLMIKDQYGRVLVNRHDLYEMLYNGVDIDNFSQVDWHEDFDKFNNAITLNHLSTPLKEPLKKLNLDVSDFHAMKQQEWFIPEEYMQMDIYQYILDRTPDVGLVRVETELKLYDKYGLTDILRVCVYIVDTLRKNNLVWGVGRGSSVASYVLYIIGVHKIDSIKYDLDIHEFLK